MVASEWVLPGHVHACVLEQDVVFLDLVQNQYASLWGAAEAFRMVDDGGGVVVADDDLAAELAGAGLIAPRVERPVRRRRRAAERCRDLGALADVLSPNTKPSEITRILSDSMLLYRGRSLAELVRHVRRIAPHDRADHADMDALAPRVWDFLHALAFVPFQGECLYRAFLMLLHLRRGGLDADWVFGVRTWPFHAHCWLQAGDLVLGDSVDRLVAYHPILVV